MSEILTSDEQWGQAMANNNSGGSAFDDQIEDLRQRRLAGRQQRRDVNDQSSGSMMWQAYKNGGFLSTDLCDAYSQALGVPIAGAMFDKNGNFNVFSLAKDQNGQMKPTLFARANRIMQNQVLERAGLGERAFELRHNNYKAELQNYTEDQLTQMGMARPVSDLLKNRVIANDNAAGGRLVGSVSLGRAVDRGPYGFSIYSSNDSGGSSYTKTAEGEVSQSAWGGRAPGYWELGFSGYDYSLKKNIRRYTNRNTGETIDVPYGESIQSVLSGANRVSELDKAKIRNLDAEANLRNAQAAVVGFRQSGSGGSNTPKFSKDQYDAMLGVISDLESALKGRKDQDDKESKAMAERLRILKGISNDYAFTGTAGGNGSSNPNDGGSNQKTVVGLLEGGSGESGDPSSSDDAEADAMRKRAKCIEAAQRTVKENEERLANGIALTKDQEYRYRESKKYLREYGPQPAPAEKQKPTPPPAKKQEEKKEEGDKVVVTKTNSVNPKLTARVKELESSGIKRKENESDSAFVSRVSRENQRVKRADNANHSLGKPDILPSGAKSDENTEADGTDSSKKDPSKMNDEEYMEWFNNSSDEERERYLGEARHKDDVNRTKSANERHGNGRREDSGKSKGRASHEGVSTSFAKTASKTMADKEVDDEIRRKRIDELARESKEEQAKWAAGGRRNAFRFSKQDELDELVLRANSARQVIENYRKRR